MVLVYKKDSDIIIKYYYKLIAGMQVILKF